MTAIGYGEDQPRLDDDRLPIVLIILDGLGDRALPELVGQTPSEAASTPNLDRVAASGMSGWHLPFGWGRAPTSELAHWALFGFEDVPFPGRAVLEALGAGLPVRRGVGTLYAALRTSSVAGQRLLITGRAKRDSDDADAAALLDELQQPLSRYGMTLHSIGGRGEALLEVEGTEFAQVTDSDPFFDTFHPWLKPLPTAASREAQDLAVRLVDALRAARACLISSRVNQRRSAAGLPPLDVLTTKWAGGLRPLPMFSERHGIVGGAVTDTRLYRGLASLLQMISVHITPDRNLAADMARRLEAADELIRRGAGFVHVHTKATDEAGHTKDPRAKKQVLEALDAGLGSVAELGNRAVVAITGDHATPSSHGIMHAGEPTPLVVAGPTVRSDPVQAFGERFAAAGWLGKVRATELLPLLAGYANRPSLMGHHITRAPAVFLPDSPEPMPIV